MIYDQIYVSLRKEFKACSFWEDHPQYCMRLFQSAFLSALHRITIINAGTLYFDHIGSRSILITEFGAAVTQNVFKHRGELAGAHTLSQTIKDKANSTFDAAPSSGSSKFFAIFFVSKSGIIVVLMGDCTVSDFFITAISDMRCPIKPHAALFYKVFACLVTGRAGRALNAIENKFSTGIGFSAMIAMNAEVFVTIKYAFVIPVGKSESYCLF